MRGIILAGGKGTRLYPITYSINKQILPIYDKPMIYYSLSILMLSNIRDILILSTPESLPVFRNLLGDGSDLGCNFSYLSQKSPKGIAESFLLGEEFIDSHKVALILGDNIFYGSGFPKLLRKCVDPDGAIIFGYHVQKPQEYGILELGKKNEVISIQEKPLNPKSNYAVPGLYFYDSKVIDYAKQIKPSNRGELEITDINNLYLQEKKLNVKLLGRGIAWLDTGTFSSFMKASSFIQTIEERQNVKIGSIEEVAYRMNYIDKPQLKNLALRFKKSTYGEYLLSLTNG